MTREEQIISEAKKYYSGNIGCYDAFLHGAEFAGNNQDLSSLYHDASEEPEEGMDILLISKNGKVYQITAIDHELYGWLKDKDFIDKWAYISDLLPKQFGNSEQLKGGEK